MSNGGDEGRDELAERRQLREAEPFLSIPEALYGTEDVEVALLMADVPAEKRGEILALLDFNEPEPRAV